MANLQEKWLPIKGHEGNYEISSFGRIRSLDRTSLHPFSGKIQLKGRLLKVWTNPNKYPRITLRLGNKEKSYTVHRLVALAFILNPESKIAVNHKDGNKQNCHVDNLEWVTYSENSIHAYQMGLVKMPIPELKYGEDHPTAKLNNVDVAMIKVLLNNGFTNVQISKRFNVHEVHISAIKLHKSRKIS